MDNAARDMTDIEPIYQRLGERVCALRYERGLTQAQLGDAVGLSRASIANVETGRQRLMLHQVLEIAEQFSVPAHELLGILSPSASELVAGLRSRNRILRMENAALKQKLSRILEAANV